MSRRRESDEEKTIFESDIYCYCCCIFNTVGTNWIGTILELNAFKLKNRGETNVLYVDVISLVF